LGAGTYRLFTEPRYARPLFADAAIALLGASAITGVLVIVVLFVRRGRYFLFDFHFLFPRAVPRWQSSAIGLVLLTLPIVFRMGLVPVLICAVFALALYLSRAERIVAGVFIVLIGLMPMIAGLLVRSTAFADTPADAAW